MFIYFIFDGSGKGKSKSPANSILITEKDIIKFYKL